MVERLMHPSFFNSKIKDVLYHHYIKVSCSYESTSNIFSVSKTMLSFGNGRKHNLKRMFEMFPKYRRSRCVIFFCTEQNSIESYLIQSVLRIATFNISKSSIFSTKIHFLQCYDCLMTISYFLF